MAEEAGDEGAIADEVPQEKQLVEGRQLEALIDTAVETIHWRLREQALSADTEEAKEARAITIQAVSSISGKKTVENVSPEFLIFLKDCYRALRG